MVADFMAVARRVLSHGVTDERLRDVGAMLAEASQEESAFVSESEMFALHGGSASFKVLQSDPDGLTLMLARFSSEETPVHDHSSWGVACVVRGRDRYRHWQLDDNGTVSVKFDIVLEPGSFVTWLDPPHDIHSQQGVGGDAIELVLFGKDVAQIPRQYYDTKTGAPINR
jgi:predicted metal-dependent enzyme (double-stranded beta helix superfamily)